MEVTAQSSKGQVLHWLIDSERLLLGSVKHMLTHADLSMAKPLLPKRVCDQHELPRPPSTKSCFEGQSSTYNVARRLLSCPRGSGRNLKLGWCQKAVQSLTRPNLQLPCHWQEMAEATAVTSFPQRKRTERKVFHQQWSTAFAQKGLRSVRAASTSFGETPL